MPRLMHLGHILLGSGSHVAGWRHPQAQFGSTNKQLLSHVVSVLEEARLDFVFFADAVSTAADVHPGMRVRLEPLNLLSYLAATTSHIGLVATVSTTYSQPYNTARSFATLDHLSNGRAGWNAVTSSDPAAALNFGLEQHPDKTSRYRMAKEYLNVVTGLWDSWEDDALVGDKETGIYTDNSKLHYLDHDGEFFKVKGPLNITRPPQGYPVFFQAGASPQGIAFAGRTAEAVFAAQQTQDGARAFRARLDDATEAAGRPRGSVKILCGVAPVVAETREAALDKILELGQLSDPVAAIRVLSERTGHDMSALPLDEPVPDLPVSEAGMQGHAIQLLDLAKREKMTVRQLRDFAGFSSGHRVVFGTPEDVADDLQAWFESGVTDGFVVMAPWLPTPIEEFCRKVVPILVERGLFRAEYEGNTLRDHLGLPRPAHFAAEPRHVAE